MDGLRIIPVTNMELIYSLEAIAPEIWHEHYDSIIGTSQVDYMIEKFLSASAITEQINQGFEYFLISYEYTFAGFCGIHEKNESLFLSKLYINRDFRGMKIGSYMFQKLIEICKMRQLQTISLTCNKNNTNTIEIYKHWGFNIKEKTITDIGNGYVMDDYIMEYAV